VGKIQESKGNSRTERGVSSCGKEKEEENGLAALPCFGMLGQKRPKTMASNRERCDWDWSYTG